jgi:hypothetical protein
MPTAASTSPWMNKSFESVSIHQRLANIGFLLMRRKAFSGRRCIAFVSAKCGPALPHPCQGLQMGDNPNAGHGVLFFSFSRSWRRPAFLPWPTGPAMARRLPCPPPRPRPDPGRTRLNQRGLILPRPPSAWQSMAPATALADPLRAALQGLTGRPPRRQDGPGLDCRLQGRGHNPEIRQKRQANNACRNSSNISPFS